MTDKLTDLRAAIDRLDDEILALLEDRFSISGKVASAKNGSVTFRPGREARIIRRLCDAAQGLDKALLLGIWRHILSASVAQQEGSLRVAVHGAAVTTAQWHFANSLSFSVLDNINELFDALSETADYILVPCDASAEIASQMYHRDEVQIVARTPLFPIPGIAPCFIIGSHAADPSDTDAEIYALRDGDNYALAEVTAASPDDVNGDNIKLIGKVAV
jgi:chorismate mutase